MQSNKSHIHILKHIIAPLIGLLSIVFVFWFFTKDSGFSGKASASSSDSGRRLMISVEEGDSRVISQEELGDHFSEDMLYSGLSNVFIEIDSETVDLAQAISNGSISVAEITAYARIDAQNGVCYEKFTSENGLSCFIYVYPEYEVKIIYDIYETPDGQQHLINDISFYAPGKSIHSSNVYIDADSQYPYSIDREDWGLQFEVLEATHTGITLSCTQSGGQLIGELQATSYSLIAETSGQQIAPINGNDSDEDFAVIQIKSNATNDISLCWSNTHGELPSGTYTLVLWLEDVYDISDVHPLMKNFYDTQRYYIEFTIP